jgi:hypothetical protein
MSLHYKLERLKTLMKVHQSSRVGSQRNALHDQIRIEQARIHNYGTQVPVVQMEVEIINGTPQLDIGSYTILYTNVTPLEATALIQAMLFGLGLEETQYKINTPSQPVLGVFSKTLE